MKFLKVFCRQIERTSKRVVKYHTPRKSVKKMTVDFLNFNLIVLKESLVKASVGRSQGLNFNRKKPFYPRT